jgi:hypothetical protein
MTKIFSNLGTTARSYIMVLSSSSNIIYGVFLFPLHLLFLLQSHESFVFVYFERGYDKGRLIPFFFYFFFIFVSRRPKKLE